MIFEFLIKGREETDAPRLTIRNPFTRKRDRSARVHRFPRFMLN